MAQWLFVGFGGYAEVLKNKPMRRLFLVAMLARLPHTAAALILTLHVVQYLDRNYGAAGLVVAATTLGMAVGAPWRGRLVDRVGLRRALIPSIIGEALLWPLAAYVSYEWLLPVAFFAGTLNLPIFSVVRQSLSVLVPPAQQRTAFSIDGITNELSFIVGPASAIFLATQTNTEITLTLIGVLGAAAGLLLFWFNPPTRSPAAPVVSTELVESHFEWLTPAILAIFAISVGATFTLNGTDVGILAQLRATGDVASLGIVFFFWCASSIVGGLIYGAIRRPIEPMLILFAMGVLTIPVGFANGVWTLSLLLIPSGMLCTPLMAATGERIARLVREERRGEAMGWQGTSFTVGAAIGAPLTGVAIDNFSPGGGFVFVGIAATVLAFAGLVATHQRRRVAYSR